MRQMVPWRLEGAYSYQELLDATRWVMLHRMNLPPAFDEAIRADFIDEIVQMIVDDADGADDVLRTLGVRSADNEERLIAALEARLTLPTLDAARFERQWNHISPLAGPADEMRWAQDEWELMLEAAHRTDAE
jgi:hypothetical protein